MLAPIDLDRWSLKFSKWLSPQLMRIAAVEAATN
jgi:hypothetical protein